MICPDCGYDNIEGVDGCEQCGQPLVDFDPSTCELEESISRHSIAVLAPKPAVCISAETTVREAIATMAQKNIGCVLVKEAERSPASLPSATSSTAFRPIWPPSTSR